MKIQIIIGSVRSGRIGDQIANWVEQQLRSRGEHQFEIIDLTEWSLPLDDEPGIPAYGEYLQPHTLAWSEKIASGDAFVFIVPQYNWGYPASLKNALDHLYTEWDNKPALIVSYANRGGGKAASQLMQVLQGLHMQNCNHNVEIALSELTLDETRRLVDPTNSLNVFQPSMQRGIDNLYSLLTPQPQDNPL